ncbi:helix-turn-helix domain-containing protein [Kitasatospora griseola]|uniref:helix-turn-helix domain-containing protein n=1 Tax=Kitasatospora griseola TaxID=2064 RepID=UPI00341303E4
MSESYPSIDALLARAPAAALPPPGERRRLRKLAGLTQDDAGKALGVSREGFGKWESGATKPRGQKFDAYRHLLARLATDYGTEGDTSWMPHPATPGQSTAETATQGE